MEVARRQVASMRSHGVLVNGPSPADIAAAEKALDALEDELAAVVEPELPEAAQGVALDPDSRLRPGGRQAAFAIAEAERAGIDTAAPESTHFAAGIRQAQDLLQALTDQLVAQEAMYVPTINELSLLTPPTVAPDHRSCVENRSPSCYLNGFR